MQTQAVGISWLVYSLTGSVLALGFIGLAQFLPTAGLALVAGGAADRFERRRILGVCYSVELACAATLLALTAAGAARAAPMLVLLVIFSAARTFEGPAAASLLPTVVPRAAYPRAAAWTTSAGHAAAVAGPALGGILFALDPRAVFAAATLLMSAAALLSTAIPRAGAAAGEPISPRSLVAGIAFIRSRPVVLGAVSMDLIAVLLGGATALLPVYARDILRVGPSGLGMLRSAPAAGAFAAAVVLAHRPLHRRLGPVLFAAVAGFGAATIVFGVSRSYVLSLGALAALGASDSVSMVVRRMLVQLSAPDALRGRVSAVSSLFTGTSNSLGQFESGVTAAWFGTVPAVLLGGAGTLAVVLLWCRWFPALRRLDEVWSAARDGAAAS